MFYRNSSTHDPIPLSIPGCDSKYESKSSEHESSETESDSSIGAAEPTINTKPGAAPANTPAGNPGEELISRRKRDVTDYRQRVRFEGKGKGKGKKPNKKAASMSKEDRGGYKHRKRRITLCKLKDFKKALIRKCTRQHDIDCRPKNPPKKKQHRSKESESSYSKSDIGRAQPIP